MKTYTVSAIAAGALLAVGCSNEPGPTQESNTVVPATNLAAPSADDDTLEPAAPKVEEDEEHDESKPHSH